MPTEYCPDCSEDAPHDVSLELREENESADPERRAFSREPYRVTTCKRCGLEESIRMNNMGDGASA